MTQLQLFVSPVRPRYRYTFEVKDRRTGETRTVTWVATNERDAWTELTVATPIHPMGHFTDVKPVRVEDF